MARTGGHLLRRCRNLPPNTVTKPAQQRLTYSGRPLRRVQFRETYLANGYKAAAAAEAVGYRKGNSARLGVSFQ